MNQETIAERDFHFSDWISRVGRQNYFADFAALLGEKLKQENVPHKIIFLCYAQHGFDYNFNGWGAQVVRPVLLNFLRENVAADK